MSNVAAILRRKGPNVVAISPHVSVLEAARLMNQHRIGAVVVTAPDEERRVVGILTERDILTRLVAGQRDPRTTTVEQLMTRNVLCCSPASTFAELRQLMHERRIRHVPVRDETGLCGLVSIGDLNVAEADGMSATIACLEQYICRG